MRLQVAPALISFTNRQCISCSDKHAQTNTCLQKHTTDLLSGFRVRSLPVGPPPPPLGQFYTCLRHVLRLYCCLAPACPVAAGGSVGLLLPSSLLAPPTVSLRLFPKSGAALLYLLRPVQRYLYARAAKESPARGEGGEWSPSPGAGRG